MSAPRDNVSFDSEMEYFWQRFEQIHHHRQEVATLVEKKDQDENETEEHKHESEELERVLDKMHASEEENRRLRREVDELSFKLQRRRKVKKRKETSTQHKKEDEEEDYNCDSLPLYSEYVRQRQLGIE